MSDDFSPSWAAGWPAPGAVVAGYRLEDRIGQGGMAVVYRAHDVRLNRRVALKLLAPALAGDAGFRQRFAGEALAAAAVDDPHIIPVFEAGEAAGVLFIAMRYVGGGDVLSLLRREGPLPLPRVVAIISPVASALDAAHAAGLVHRDVKPANMLLDVRAGRPDHVYLSDFGLSKTSLAGSGLTGTGHFIGTLDYVSPEQIQGRTVDGRADQYALACAVFELLSGEPPFGRDQGLAVVAQHLSAVPPLVRSRRPGLPGGVDRVLAQALAKAPSDRFASCGEFGEALRAALGLPSYDAGSADSPRGHTPTQVAALPTGPAVVAPERAQSGPPELAQSEPPGPGAGEPPGPRPETAPGRADAWAATVDASRAEVLPRPAPGGSAPGPEPEPGQQAAGAGPDKAAGAGPDKTALPGRGQPRGWRPGRRALVTAAAGTALAAAVIAVIISLQPTPARLQPTPVSLRSTPASLRPTPADLVPRSATAYVANLNDNTVTPIDLATGRAGTPIFVGIGSYPGAVAITPDGKTAYVANISSDATLTPIDLATGRTGTPIQLGPGGAHAIAVAITPDGKTAYLTEGTAVSEGTVTPIDLVTGRAGTPIQVGIDPDSIAITPDGKAVYVPSFYDGTVTPIDVATGRVGTAIPAGSHPYAVAITPDGATAYVAQDNTSGTVTPIDVATGRTGAPIPVGIDPDAIAITPDGETAYVVNSGANTVTPIDVATGRAGTPIPMKNIQEVNAHSTEAIAIAPDGKTAYVANFYDNTVTPIDLVTGRAGTPIPVGINPVAIAIAP